MRKRASIVLIRDSKILLIRRENEKGLYYIFPGGGIEEGEIAEQTVVREAMEEAGILIEAEQVVFVNESEADYNVLVSCRQLDTKEPMWLEEEKQTETNKYAFEWIPLVEIPTVDLLPTDGKEFILSMAAR